ncbi:MAG: hypothetical protein PHC41_10120 [Lachnospiraceae bacterium]|nr:hypothetical protein [Lachnospiraceae bacterium]MDD3616566.1 hypothetical protein [Lachnospiraceae bacterium]
MRFFGMGTQTQKHHLLKTETVFDSFEKMMLLSLLGIQGAREKWQTERNPGFKAREKKWETGRNPGFKAREKKWETGRNPGFKAREKSGRLEGILV